MTKSLYLILGSTIIIGLSIFSMTQFGTVIEKEKTIQKQISEISDISYELEGEIIANNDLRSENEVLKEEVSMLRDSIFNLRTIIRSLKRKVNKQDRVIKNIQGKLKSIELQYARLKVEISELAKNDVVDKGRINQLENEKKNLRKELTLLNVTKEKIEVEKQVSEKKLMEQKVNEARYKKISHILNNTQVKFEKISVHKKRYGKKVSKIKKKNWYYTVMEFTLINEDIRALLDEHFKVKIVNSDTQEILSFIESNPNFPESSRDSKGLHFNYDGNLIEVTYYNNQKKKGENYEIQVSYVGDDGKEHLLRHGVKKFIQDRKVLK